MTGPLDRIALALTGRYRVEREAGAGGMATVYLAEDTKHHRQVAVKVLRPELAASMGSVRFLREIEIAAGLSHPHILPLYDSGSSDGVLFYVMPFVDGPSLRDRMRSEGALPIADAVRLIREIADALGYAHGRGLIHRDIKPENILLSGTHALVADFGVAKAVSDAAGAASMTATGMALGTPAYMAPEQAMAEPTLDHRVDLYALGVMAYEMLAGRGPFTATSAQQLISAHLTKVPDPLSVHRADVPPALEAVVMRCLEKDPAARWANAGDLLAALDTVLTPVGTTSPVAASAAPGVAVGAADPRRGAAGAGAAGAGVSGGAALPAAPRRRGPLIAAGGAALILALGGFGAMRYTQTGRAGTLIGKDVLEANDIVLVSEFENHSGDSTLSATVTDAVRADMQQSRTVQVMSQAAMWAGLKRMGLERGVALQAQKVQELAEREGAKAFVVGDIARLGAGYQLVARVVATKDGSEQLIARATAKNDAELIAALEDVGRTLRTGIGESLRSVANAPPLAKVTTASLPALRAYTAAQRAENTGERRQAVALAREAIALDSAFASAYSLLYVVYSNMDSISAATAAAERANALADRLGDVARLQNQARVAAVRGDRDGEERAWQRLAEMGHDQVNYANMLMQQGRVAEAEVMAHRGVVSDSRVSVAYWNLAEAQAALLHWSAADSTARLIAEKLPDNPYRLFIPFRLLWARRDLDGVDAFLATPEGRTMPGADRVGCIRHLWRGRIQSWRQCSLGVNGNPMAALADFRLTGDSARARATWDSFLARPVAQRDLDRYVGIIVLLADVGRVREAEALLDEWRQLTGPKDPGYRADSASAVGAIAVAKGQWERAIAAYRAWREAPSAGSSNWYNRGLPEAAMVYRRVQQPDSALALLERALETTSLTGGIGYEVGWYPEALVALGELHEQKGHKDKAVDYYRTYINLMKDADAPIAAQVAEVRERVFRLTGEPGQKR